jgi:hypothetical protein
MCLDHEMTLLNYFAPKKKIIVLLINFLHTAMINQNQPNS